ncbi:MAG: MotA/TolQ/ExbB proton channel family protein, partial [Sinobacterium sp.]|nr:MotA/TolQ/ExbB proton channel family protein [Sinobacterium sp.]
DPTGPSGGSLLAALINTPSVVERWQQGGIVGIVISVLGVIAILVGALRLLVLTGMSAKVSKQLKQVENPDESNPLGRVLAQAASYKDADLETLELKMNEAIIKELPSLQRFESFLKITAAVAPLLGLLGTVVGMILTFQAITIYGAGDPQAMAGGISSALVTTVLGLIVAIPTLLMHSFVSAKSNTIIHVLEEQAAGLVASFNEKQV